VETWGWDGSLASTEDTRDLAFVSVSEGGVVEGQRSFGTLATCRGDVSRHARGDARRGYARRGHTRSARRDQPRAIIPGALGGINPGGAIPGAPGGPKPGGKPGDGADSIVIPHHLACNLYVRR
jgi:hypothetical protein